MQETCRAYAMLRNSASPREVIADLPSGYSTFLIHCSIGSLVSSQVQSVARQMFHGRIQHGYSGSEVEICGMTMLQRQVWMNGCKV
jgi:hypothetical protein